MLYNTSCSNTGTHHLDTGQRWNICCSTYCETRTKKGENETCVTMFTVMIRYLLRGCRSEGSFSDTEICSLLSSLSCRLTVETLQEVFLVMWDCGWVPWEREAGVFWVFSSCCVEERHVRFSSHGLLRSTWWDSKDTFYASNYTSPITYFAGHRFPKQTISFCLDFLPSFPSAICFLLYHFDMKMIVVQHIATSFSSMNILSSFLGCQTCIIFTW